MTLSHAAIATGRNFPDALAGAVLCGRTNSVMVLAKDASSAGLQTIFAGRGGIATGLFLGGEGAVSPELAAEVERRTA